ncbi:MAG TPA: M1 family metallopeptidase [Chitinophagaceae bacterium]|nr:M1 family metallopeptidase [Chitinophagaceae bacterium]
MRLLKVLIPFLLLASNAFSQHNYWQQRTNYTIDVALDDKEHTLDGFLQIEYVNNSPDTLRFIWFHLWPNAYKNDKTAFSDQLLENGNTKFYFSNNEEKGYINRLDFKINGITAITEDHPRHIDILKVILPSALSPGQKVNITTPFHVKLPYNFSRGGHDGQSYQVTQWYPKPAVYDKNGWHPMPYLDQGEFYSEFGDYKVNITVPENYVVAATGELQNETEKEWLKNRNNYTWDPEKSKEKQNNGKPIIPSSLHPPSSANIKTIEFQQKNVHDFAWFADKRFIVNDDTCMLASGRVITVTTFYTPSQKKYWNESITYTKNAIKHYSALAGEYPYNNVKVVQGPKSFGGGMEYPTITVISPTTEKISLEETIVHEVGHNWFYGIIGTNERDYPWMDEGINSYLEEKYSKIRWGSLEKFEQLAYESTAVEKTDQPISSTSEQFSEINYNLTAYYKTAEWLRYLENQIGEETLKKGIQEYFNRWQFRHPRPEDFKKVLEDISEKKLDNEFALLNKKGTLPNQVRKGTKTFLLFNSKGLKSYLKNPSKELLTIGPVIGANSYDKIMPGIFLTNIKLPPSKLQYLLTLLYGTGSKKINGIGFISQSFYPAGIFRKIDLGISGSVFTIDEYSGNSNEKFYLGMNKFVPGIRLTFRETNSRNSFNRFIQFKSYIINEEGLRFFRDTIINGNDTSVLNKVGKTNTNRIINQLKVVIENNRALYPYRGEIKVEQGTDFIRTAFTGNYFFNYAKEGGFNIRIFAGKFFYTASKTFTRQFATDRYHLNLTGANGYEDYTYSDYFIGRNKFEGFASQQIMNRDGGFKVRTDLLANKVGKTDDWLLSANFSTSIPSAINPLSVLPIKIPVKLFLDVGTHADAWKEKAETDRFLFDAGLQISLFKETVNFYLPLVYSNVFKDYIQSTLAKKGRMWKTISFSIDISNFSFRKIDRNLNF